MTGCRTTVMDKTSETLLHRVRDRGDDGAWDEFFRIYAPLLERFARGHGLSAGDAEEVRDQCLEVVARKMPAFEYERARGGFKGWLYRIAHGKVVDHLRKPAARRAETHELGGLVDRAPDPEEAWEGHWRSEHLRYCLEHARLREPERSFQAFELLLMDGLSVPEVCERMGMNANQVYKAKSRVLRRVRETFERIGTGAAPPLD